MIPGGVREIRYNEHFFQQVTTTSLTSFPTAICSFKAMSRSAAVDQNKMATLSDATIRNLSGNWAMVFPLHNAI